MPLVPYFLKGTKKGETTCNFKIFLAHFQSQNYFHNTCILTPWQDAGALIFSLDLSPWEVVEAPPQEGGTSTTSGDEPIVTTSSSLQNQETIS